MYANIHGFKMYFDVEGSGYVAEGAGMKQKEPCVFLHGGPGSDHSDFKPWMSPLADEYQLIYIDHRGNGQSERTELASCTIEQMADDLEAFRQYLGLDKLIVAGHSFGGMVAQMYATKYQEQIAKLILICTAPSIDFWKDALAFAQNVATPQQLEVLPNLFEGRIKDEEELEKWWELCLPLYFYKRDPKLMHEVSARPIGSLEVSNYMFKHEMPNYDVRSKLPNVQTKTLVVAGRHDWITPVTQGEEIHRLLPHAKLEVFEESGHMPFIEEQEKFINTVKAFLHSFE